MDNGRIGYIKVIESSNAVLIRAEDILDGLKVKRVEMPVVKDRIFKTKIVLEINPSREKEIWLEHGFGRTE